MALAFFASAVAQNQTERVPAKGFAVFSATDTFHPYEFTRHAVGDNDILIETLYAGIARSARWTRNSFAEIDKAYRNVQDGKVKFRYVIDMSTIK